ncbi:hypothetical protein CJ030_MR4G020923 [Morella rubra]|uniref:Uncharacterized protein n=1 Tax=Morella rubra TaxID=262757 RepID=A0A6A1W0S4_9ROSI|nr:hypothetical protein CJ030_MR4G020923 [Morella rubra]
MAIGGKCQRSALTVSSNHLETSQPMQSTLSTTSRAPTVSAETPITSPGLAQSSVASTTPAKRGCGKSRRVIFAKVQGNVRMHAPFGTSTWAKVSNSIKEYIRERVLERSRINTTNRAKLKVHHTGGSRPFVWHRKKLQDPEIGTPTAADLYSKTHHKKNGEGWVSDVARENYEKMVEIQSQSTTESGAPKDIDIFTQVLGTRSDYVRGLGRSMKPIAASSSTMSIQRDSELVRELEAAKATIEELKSRQSEYDNLKNQQVQMQEAQRQIQEQLQLLKAQFAQRDS